jgi:O-antigen/teichoic acid export membrane protein
MKAHLSNAAYGILDYGAFPIGMLVVAPILLRNLGLAQYGVWAVASAALSIGGVIASGFGDANIQYLASHRSEGDPGLLERAVRSMIGINLVLGGALAILCWLLAPIAAARVTAHVMDQAPALEAACLWSLRITSVLLALRAMETVCISTQRAFERYGAAVRISIAARLLALALAAASSYVSHSVVAIVLATGLLMSAGLWLQLVKLKRLLGAQSLMPAFDRNAMQALMSFGLFSWLQAVAGVVFSQVDRLMLGVSLGASAVASYALCTQMAQPIFGFSAGGLHFLFPYLANRRASSSDASLRRPVLIALGCNVLFVAVTGGGLLWLGQRILHLWAGATVAQAAEPVLPMIVWSSALLGLNVTATYALLSMGSVRVVTAVNLAGGALMLVLMFALTPRFGIQGIALARLVFSLLPLALYLPLFRRLYLTPADRSALVSLEPVGGKP